MKNILSIGYSITSKNNDDYESIDNRVSLSDADLVVFCPDFDTAFYHRDEPRSYQGKPIYNSHSSFKIREDAQHWRREINSYLDHGNTIFIFLKERYEFFIHTGQKTTSGTGRNQKVTNVVEPFDNYKFIPLSLKVQNASGKTVTPKSDVVKTYSKSFHDFLNFEAYLEMEDIKSPLFTSKNGDKVLGVRLRAKNGRAIVLPYLEYDEDEFWDFEKDQWTNEGITFGKKLVSCLIEIDKETQSKTSKTPKPEWVDSEAYQLKESLKTKKLIENNKTEIVRISKENEELSKVLEEQESLKDLLFETGKPLELAVSKAFRLLGYQAENFDDGNLELDQVILSPEGDRYIGECEGKDNKDIDISKFRQLLDSLNEDFMRDEVEEKGFGILIGNPQRLVDPEKRNLTFTKKCTTGAKREQVGLILTTELFNVSKYLLENKNATFQKKCRKAIKHGLGNIIRFPQPPEKK